MSVKIHKCFESLINNILPICDNFKTIKNFTDNHYGFEYGSIIHAFCLPIRKIQNEHYQVIAKYENCPNLTIGLLLSNLQIPNEILKLLKNVIDKIGSSRGISVLTTLQKYYSTFRGAEHIRKILLYLFQETMKPFLRFIEKWIYEGIIEDPYDEFFIKLNQTITKDILGDEYEEKYWLYKYELINDRIPPNSFMSYQIIKDILYSGKCKSILRICGTNFINLKNLTTGCLQREFIFDSVCEQSSNELINVLYKKYNMLNYFKYFHDYFLGGKGDWIEKLFELNKDIMGKDRENINTFSLETTLSICLPKCLYKHVSCKLENNIVFEEIKRIHNANATTKFKLDNKFLNNWEFFNIYFSLKWPINLIFHKGIQKKYQLLFRIILMWRRLEKKLGNAWLLNIKLKRYKIYLHSMQLFVHGYLNFISTFTIQSQWNKLQQSLCTINSIDELYKIHENYLNTILKEFFIIEPNIFRKISHIWYICFDYVEELEKWYESVRNKFTNKNNMLELGQPLNKLYKNFEKYVRSLIEELYAVANREANNHYIDFANFININDSYYIRY